MEIKSTVVPGRRVFVNRWSQHVIAQSHISPKDVLLTTLPICTGGSEYCAICGVACPMALSVARYCKGRGRLRPSPFLGHPCQTSRSVWNWRRR